MPPRLLAIGDIHGCLAALEAVLAAASPTADDVVVTLGDYVDRGPDVRGVIDTLLALAGRTQLVSLLGNHEEMLLRVADGRLDLLADWLVYGGEATLASYGVLTPQNMPMAHCEFLRACRMYYEVGPYFFIHGNYREKLPLSEQPPAVALWQSLRQRTPGPHYSGKTAIVGHTAQKNGEILDLGHLRCIDTYCYGTGWLTAMDVMSREVWQADKDGRIRDSKQEPRDKRDRPKAE
jgi:serine/threonine protein phosphatase 1